MLLDLETLCVVQNQRYGPVGQLKVLVREVDPEELVTVTVTVGRWNLLHTPMYSF